MAEALITDEKGRRAEMGLSRRGRAPTVNLSFFVSTRRALKPGPVLSVWWRALRPQAALIEVFQSQWAGAESTGVSGSRRGNQVGFRGRDVFNQLHSAGQETQNFMSCFTYNRSCQSQTHALEAAADHETLHYQRNTTQCEASIKYSNDYLNLLKCICWDGDFPCRSMLGETPAPSDPAYEIRWYVIEGRMDFLCNFSHIKTW